MDYKCPICDAECKHEKYAESVGTVEEHIECPNHCYNYQFAYGDTEIMIGDFIAGYNHRITEERKESIGNAIAVLVQHYKDTI